MDYIILFTLIILFLLKQYESVLTEKIKFSKDSFEENQYVKRIEKNDKIFNFLIFLFTFELLFWLYNL